MGDDMGGDDGGQSSLYVQMENLHYDRKEAKTTEARVKLARELIACQQEEQFEAFGSDESEFASQWLYSAHECVAVNSLSGDVAAAESSAAGLEALKQFFAYSKVNNATPDELNDSIQAILNVVTDAALRPRVLQMAKDFLGNTSAAARLFYEIDMQQLDALIEAKQFKPAVTLLNRLHKSCQSGAGSNRFDDVKQFSSELVAIYAKKMTVQLEAGPVLGPQLVPMTLRELYTRTSGLWKDTEERDAKAMDAGGAAEVTHSFKDTGSVATLKECWGRLFAQDGNWRRAYTEFHASFGSFADSMNTRSKMRVLKYVIVASMMSNIQIDVLATRKVISCLDDHVTQEFAKLRRAWEACDVDAFEQTFANFKAVAVGFLQPFFGDILANFRKKCIIRLIAPYRLMRLKFLAARIHVDTAELQTLLCELILDEQIDGRINQAQMVVELGTKHAGSTERKSGGSGGNFGGDDDTEYQGVLSSEAIDAKRCVAIDAWVKALRTRIGSVQPHIQLDDGGAHGMMGGFGGGMMGGMHHRRMKMGGRRGPGRRRPNKHF
jgi:hypothetical protein